jgi:hypothetical protein
MKLQQKKQKENRIWQLDKNTKDNPILHYRYMKTTFYCPLCGTRFDASEYLCETFKGDDKALWLANMVTHYRHTHITSWNKYWGWNGWAYRKAAHFGDYDKEKSIVNERAKRQIARKCPQYIISNGIDLDVYSKLQGTTEETLSVVDKIWSVNNGINN